MSDCRETCAYHAERDTLIADINTQINDNIGPSVNQHKAYWKFFFWGAGIGLSIMIGLTLSIRESVQEVSEVATKLERTVSNQALRSGFLEKRFEEYKTIQETMRARVRALENSHNER